jgi:hypothetical protein
VPPGSYLLSVFSRDHRFENLRVDVSADGSTGVDSVAAWTTFRGNEWDNKGELRGEGEDKVGETVKIEVKVVSGKVYYQQRASCKYTICDDLQNTNLP